MSWFWLALGSAFFLASADYLTKRHLSDLPVGQMVLVRLTGLAPVCLAVLAFTPMPPIEPAFYWAAGLALPAYMVAGKRLSIIIAVLYGGVFLKEARLGQHLMASGLMVAGAVVILLAG